MLLTVTANPSTDRILHVPQLTPGSVHRAIDVEMLAAGKGINVARAARSLDTEILATGILAGKNGQTLANLAASEGLPADWYRLPAGETRICTLLNHDSGDTTVINENGPRVTDAGWSGFAGHVRQLAANACAVAFSGSVPPGVPPNRLSQLARSLANERLPVFVDTSSTPLRSVLAYPERVWVKVNQGELADGLDVTLADRPVQQLAGAARTLLARGAAGVVVTLGSQGALAVTRQAVWQAVPPPVTIASTVGSGDSMLAGLAAALLRGQSLPQALVLGVACGTANALTGEPGRFNPDDVETIRRQVEVHQIPA